MHYSSFSGSAAEKHVKPHWAYTGSEGLSHWGRLSAKYSIYSTGQNQSPINESTTPDSLSKPGFHYQSVPMSILNNGHTIQINYGTVDNNEENKVKIAVVAVLFNYGDTDSFLSNPWKKMPSHAGPVTTYHNLSVNGHNLLPRSKSYYHYREASTTQPCSEGVRRSAMRSNAQVSQEQVGKFKSIVGINNRPIQHRNNSHLLRT